MGGGGGGEGNICDLSDTCVSHENGVDTVISKTGGKSIDKTN